MLFTEYANLGFSWDRGVNRVSRRKIEHDSPKQKIKLNMLDGVEYNTWDYICDEEPLN